MRESVSELLARVNELEDQDARVRELQLAGNGRLQQLLQIALNSNVKFLLPEGTPPYKAEFDHLGHGILWQEIRRLPIFLEGGTLQHLPQRREHLFLELLESVHPRDAKLLIAMKDHEWPFERIDATTVNRAFPGLITEE